MRWLLLALTVSACAPSTTAVEPLGTRTCVEGCEAPAWCSDVVEAADEHFSAYCGVSSQYRMERQARASAEMEAWKAAVHALGVDARELANQVLRQAGATSEILDEAIAQQVTARFSSAGRALGEVERWHVQRWELKSSGGLETYYVARALYRVSRAKVAEYAQALLADQQAKERDEKNRETLQAALEQLDAIVELDGF